MFAEVTPLLNLISISKQKLLEFWKLVSNLATYRLLSTFPRTTREKKRGSRWRNLLATEIFLVKYSQMILKLDLFYQTRLSCVPNKDVADAIIFRTRFVFRNWLKKTFPADIYPKNTMYFKSYVGKIFQIKFFCIKIWGLLRVEKFDFQKIT